MPTRIADAAGEAVALAGTMDGKLAGCEAAESRKGLDENALVRSFTAEVRAAFTYVTIAQLAYDMGQFGRGDRAFDRAQQACAIARLYSRQLSRAAYDLVDRQLNALLPVFDACTQQRSDFHATLRQPSLN